MQLDFQLARHLGGLAELKALEIKVPVSIAVADSRGETLFYGRMDHALPASPNLAQGKAYTAAILRMSTQGLAEMVVPGKGLYGIQHNFGEKLVVFGGGVPLKLSGKIVGSIGISGGSVQEDVQIAESVSNSLNLMQKTALNITLDYVDSSTYLDLNKLHTIVSENLRQHGSYNQFQVFILAGGIYLAVSKQF